MSYAEYLPFPRISPDHPLTRAARDVNAYADHNDLPKTLAWIGLEADPSEMAYLAQQRALRACCALWFEHSMGSGDDGLDEMFAIRVLEDPRWPGVRQLLIGAYLDGMAIGWHARAMEVDA